jgi:hypothetical protein
LGVAAEFSLECTNTSCSWSLLLAHRGSKVSEIAPCASVFKKGKPVEQVNSSSVILKAVHSGTAGLQRGSTLEEGAGDLGLRDTLLSSLGH